MYVLGLGALILETWRHTDKEAWGEIIHPFPNFNGTTDEAWEWSLGMAPHRHQATSAGILLIEIFGTNFTEILTKLHTFLFK